MAQVIWGAFKGPIDSLICNDDIGIGITKKPKIVLSPCLVNLLTSALGIGVIVLAAAQIRSLTKLEKKTKRTHAYWFKLVTVFMNIILSLALAVYNQVSYASGSTIYKYGLVSEWIFLLAAVFLLPYTALSHFRSKRPSFTLSVFWSLMFFVRMLHAASLGLINKRRYGYTPTSIALICALSASSLAAALAESTKKKYTRKFPEEEITPDYLMNLPQRLFVTTVLPSVIKARRTQITPEDTMPLHRKLKVKYQSARLEKRINRELSKKSPSLMRAMLSTYKYEIACTVALKFVHDILIFLVPSLIKLLVDHFNTSTTLTSPEDVNGAKIGAVFIATFILFISTFKTFCLHQFFYIVITLGSKLSSTFSYIIYKKGLRISPESRTKIEPGKIINLMSADASKLEDFWTYAHMVWSAPLQIVLGIVSLYKELGKSFIFGLIPMFVIIGVNMYLVKIERKLRLNLAMYEDIRIKFLSEILRCIRVIKLQAWELSMAKKVKDIREKVLKVMRLIYYTNGVRIFSWSSTTVLMTLVSFMLYAYMGDVPLTSSKVASSIYLFGLIQYPVLIFPAVIASYVNLNVVFKRLLSLLVMDDDKSDYFVALSETEKATGKRLPAEVSMKKCNFSWSYEENATSAIKDIDFSLKGPCLAVFVGRIGSGKSTVLSSVLGLTRRLSGELSIRGRITCVTQTPWIMDCSFKENLIFGRPYDSDKYEKIIDACYLRYDIDNLPDKDDTIVGERGFNLSGGQKQRLCIARAIYADADIYVLDDILSAVDPKSERHIFDHVLSKNGLLSSKLVLFSTQSRIVLDQADVILMMDKGEIIARGTYDDIVNNPRSSSFIEVLLNRGITADDKPDKSEKTLEASKETGLEPSKKFLARNEDDDRKKRIEADNERIERVTAGSLNKATYLYYFKSCGLLNCTLLLLTTASTQVFDALQKLYLTTWSSSNDVSLINNSQVSDNSYYIALVGIFGAVSIVSVFSSTMVGAVLCSLRASRRIHNQAIDAVLAFKLSFFDLVSDGRTVNRLTADIQKVDFAVEPQAAVALSMSLSIIAIIVMNTLSIGYLSLVFIVFGLIFYACFKVYIAITRQLRRLSSISMSSIFTTFNQSLEGVVPIKYHDQTNNFIQNALTSFHNLQRLKFSEVYTRRCLTVALEIMENLIVFLCGLVGALSFGSISIRNFSLVVIYSQSISQKLSWFVRTLCMLEAEAVSVERIREYINIEGEQKEILGEPAPPGWPLAGKIEFVDYTAKYREGSPAVLKDISITINPGEKIGVVGRTGAGKTSFAMSLYRVLETISGKILIDNVDISRLGLHELRSKLSIVPQDPILFIGTIRNNIDPFYSRSDEECWDALRAAGAESLVRGLPGQMEFEVTKDGENISLGERQLICLARSIINKSNVVVMDESTASVDKENDAAIQEKIKTVFKNSTLIVIAHRLETILDSDRIIVMADGYVKEFDKPSVLINKEGGIFKEMIEAAMSQKKEDV